MNRRKFVQSLAHAAVLLAAVSALSAGAASVGDVVTLPPITLIDGTQPMEVVSAAVMAAIENA
jgi:hypothetical protein